MNNKKLNQIGSKLNISEKEIKKIKNTHDKEKIIKNYTLLLTGSSLVSLIMGYVTGRLHKEAEMSESYPSYISYNLAFLPFFLVSMKKTEFIRMLIIGLLASLIFFVVGFKIGVWHETQMGGIMYNVYSKGRNP